MGRTVGLPEFALRGIQPYLNSLVRPQRNECYPFVAHFAVIKNSTGNCITTFRSCTFSWLQKCNPFAS